MTIITISPSSSSHLLLIFFSPSHQVHVDYRKPDGGRYLRVITEKRPLSDSRKTSEKSIDVSVVALGSVQLASRLALDGDMDRAKKVIWSVGQLFKRAAKSDNQLEEYAEWKARTRDLYDSVCSALKSDGVKDGDVKVFYNMKSAFRVTFLAGDRKKEACSTRKLHLIK